jgi:osmotically-inducible protein OsmY
LRRDERTAEASFTVECCDGVAKLLGVVDTPAEASAAADVARAIEGVKSVDNQLKAAAAATSRFRREG